MNWNEWLEAISKVVDNNEEFDKLWETPIDEVCNTEEVITINSQNGQDTYDFTQEEWASTITNHNKKIVNEEDFDWSNIFGDELL